MSYETPKGTPGAAPQLQIHFIKGTCFRVVHANGVWYGGDNQGNIHMTFFNERSPIPKMMVINLDERGAVLGEDLSKRESKQGIVREMEVDIVLSIPAALDLYKTLGENIKAIQSVMELPAEEREKIIQERIKYGSLVLK